MFEPLSQVLHVPLSYFTYPNNSQYATLYKMLIPSFVGNLICVFYISQDYEAVVKLSDGFNGADLRNVCTEAGMLLYICVRQDVCQVRDVREQSGKCWGRCPPDLADTILGAFFL